MPFEYELQVARQAAVEAGLSALTFRELGIPAETKPDDSPVTAADRESERIISQALSEAFPEDGLLGEEGVSKESRSGRRWIIDPIDGTRDYVRGYPGWAVLIGLEQEGEVVVGVAHLPALHEMFFASKAGGAWQNDAPMRVSSITSKAQAVLCANGLKFMQAAGMGPRLVEWMSGFWTVRAFGGCPDAMLLASGRAEVYIEPHVKEWDVAPLKIILEEAGAKFFNFDGGSSIYGGTCAACVPALQDEVLGFLQGGKDVSGSTPGSRM